MKERSQKRTDWLARKVQRGSEVVKNKKDKTNNGAIEPSRRLSGYFPEYFSQNRYQGNNTIWTRLQDDSVPLHVMRFFSSWHHSSRHTFPVSLLRHANILK